MHSLGVGANGNDEGNVMIKRLRNLSPLAIIGLILLSPQSNASDDPCIRAMMKSSPGQVPGLIKQRDGYARPKAMERTDWAINGQEDQKNNEAQTERDWAGDANDFSGKWHSEAAPQFFAGAMKETDPKTKATLMECHSRRSRQGAADKETAEKNHKAAAQAREGDTVEIAMAGYQPKVTTVENFSNPPPIPGSLSAPPAPNPNPLSVPPQQEDLAAQLAPLRTVRR